jgi:RNA polymerase sigma factor (sigma-70 family)
MAAVFDHSDRVGSQSTEPFDTLHARFSCRLKRFFLSYRLNAADADDLTQDVFVRLAGLHGHTDLLKPEAFVFTLARNLVRDRARRLHTRAALHSVALDDIDLSCERPTPDQYLESQQLLARADRTLAALKPRTREAFVLHRVHGESYATIAAHMDISVSMVEKHIMSALLALRAVNA